MNFSRIKENMEHANAYYVKILSTIASKVPKKLYDYMATDPYNMMNLALLINNHRINHPNKWGDYVKDYFEKSQCLWNHFQKFFSTSHCDPLYMPGFQDRKVSHHVWNKISMFYITEQYYLMNTHWIRSIIEDLAKDLSPRDIQKLSFITKQFLDMCSPSNYLFTNPEVIRSLIETEGENLVKGMQQLWNDLQKSSGILQISTNDKDAFKVGSSLAQTKGRVIYQNELMQLIHYYPLTEKQHSRPLLIIPPWINKFYILDLSEKNSFVRWILQQGYSVFMISWINPDSSFSHYSFEDYMRLGPLAALDVLEKKLNIKEVNSLGYCLGGTLLSCMLAYLAAHKDTRLYTATFLTTLLDFSQAGDMGLLIEEEKILHLEQYMSEKGYLSGEDLSLAFNLIRANDMIWNYIVKNYLLGEKPPIMDILFWNQDNTRLPSAMQSFYLRNMYLHNKLIQEDALIMCDTPINLKKIKTPSYFVGAREDHIVPWEGVYKSMHYTQGKNRFCLSRSGHVGGIINPPYRKKYSYWIHEKDASPKSSEEWLNGAKEHEGSWWDDWACWQKDHAGPLIAPYVPLEGIEAAPGQYVTMR